MQQRKADRRDGSRKCASFDDHESSHRSQMWLSGLYGLMLLGGALKSILECDVGVGEGDSLKLISLQVVIQLKRVRSRSRISKFQGWKCVAIS
ncbi:unnamed protein product [Eruca vesicaria subsp. sativa]|uniref:Uncharacterized protein n=1 Tax=Eruca vesicaria subsp. sativa TaxID=29727 RepID=A0ABC8K8B3_ERUVS|nr:unnamed protein product [Eruca vesicaria subsp. sativa]